eukprot:TRINITY_DN1160_c0_g1_i4.p1 TRINITY_DN1160_c0_g1~~TRINITY_DN1160_c0_g1_i4.p1  ORF type:complete len:305 (-),score=60.54 TRINITY_DN1160_c0_g1_i4:38-952(-)
MQQDNTEMGYCFDINSGVPSYIFDLGPDGSPHLFEWEDGKAVWTGPMTDDMDVEELGDAVAEEERRREEERKKKDVSYHEFLSEEHKLSWDHPLYKVDIQSKYSREDFDSIKGEMDSFLSGWISVVFQYFRRRIVSACQVGVRKKVDARNRIQVSCVPERGWEYFLLCVCDPKFGGVPPTKRGRENRYRKLERFGVTTKWKQDEIFWEGGDLPGLGYETESSEFPLDNVWYRFKWIEMYKSMVPVYRGWIRNLGFKYDAYCSTITVHYDFYTEKFVGLGHADNPFLRSRENTPRTLTENDWIAV